MGKPDGNPITEVARKKAVSMVRDRAKQQREARAASEAADAAKAKQAENSLAASKEQIGKQAALSAQRAAAEGAARDLTATSQAAPDVAVDTGAPAEDDTSAGGVKRRRQRFGIGTESSGVNI